MQEHKAIGRSTTTKELKKEPCRGLCSGHGSHCNCPPLIVLAVCLGECERMLANDSQRSELLSEG